MSIDLSGVAALITAVAVLTTSIGTLYFMGRKINFNKQRIEETHVMVKQIDSAVNGKSPGETTMVSQVQDLHDEKFPPAEPFTNGNAILPLLRRLALDVEELKKQAGIGGEIPT